MDKNVLLAELSTMSDAEKTELLQALGGIPKPSVKTPIITVLDNIAALFKSQPHIKTVYSNGAGWVLAPREGYDEKITRDNIQSKLDAQLHDLI